MGINGKWFYFIFSAIKNSWKELKFKDLFDSYLIVVFKHETIFFLKTYDRILSIDCARHVITVCYKVR